MKRIEYIKPLPCGMWRTYHQYYVLTAVYSAIATAFLTSTHSIFVAIIYAIALISFVMGTIKKKKIAEEGCKEIILKVSEYTYIPKILSDKGKPSGMLLGEEATFPISMFPIEGRSLYEEKDRYRYWKTMNLGGEPPECLWKEDLYREHADSRSRK